MKISIYIRTLIFLTIAFSTLSSKAQLSKTHYIPPLTSAEFGNANPEDQYIYISTPSNSDISYIITPIGLPATSVITGVVSNTNPVVVSIGSGNGQLFVPSSQTSTVTNKGYLIEADDVIYASIRMNAGGGAQAGALVSKGVSALGTQFRVGSYTNENPQSNYLNFVSVMATEDDTQVVFDNLPAGLVIKNYSGTTPVTITLDENESYIIATNSLDSAVNRDGLIGCLVTANKNVVVNCGSANGSFFNGQGRDYGIDQIVDVSKTGTEYIFVRGDGDNNWENVLIVAHYDNTSISINGAAPITTINAGDYYLIEGNNYNASGNMYVETSQDAFAYQGVGGLGSNGSPSEANQGMFFVPPLSCEARGNIDNIANIEDIGATNYSGGLSIVTRTGATVLVNGLPIANFNTQGPNNVTGNPDYETYKVTGLSGNISVACDDELYCAYFNYNGAATSGSFYAGFPSIPEINFEADFVALGNCIPNVTLSAANTDSFDSYQWWFDDGSGFVNLNVSTPDYTPLLPGTYKLIGEVTCSGLVLESDEVPVSLCPDDVDNDGIIDNLDLDNDNDGILNCEESNGDAILNLSNINLPQIQLQNGTFSAIVSAGTLIQTNGSGNVNTFSGDNLGNFTSMVSPDVASSNEFSIDFSETVHVLLSEDTSVNHTITDGEYFTVKILPLEKNITLTNPDNRLLVDTDFDGVFEENVTQISGSEIRFRINPTPAGTTPYQFSANAVSGFTFVHNLNNLNNSSTYQANLSLSCFKLDSDLDGIENALDLDTDNDGVPDFIESLGNNFMLPSGVDVDNNGLDDVFDVNGTPIDTDGDGVLDYLDLDSDNDGIHDLFETGQLGLLSDTDVNGIVDGPITNLGANGWYDAAETFSDSGVIAYILNDFDNDSNFSYLDLDSDGDDCSDVIEAGFSDGNIDDLLGDNAVQVDDFGLVNNAVDGYTIPNINYLISAPIQITTQPVDTSVCEASNAIITIEGIDVNHYQWEQSIDGVTWNVLNDDTVYSGTATNELTVSNTQLTYNNYQFRVFINRDGNSCGLYSEEIMLTVNPLPIVNSPVVLIQCDDDTDGFSAFNLDEANNSISANAANETFTFYLTQASAYLGDEASVDFIQDPTVFINQNVSSGVVWARVQSNFGCVSVSEVQLQVSTTAIPSTYQRVFNVCDDFLDINGVDNANNDDADGVSTFDFSSVTAEILAFIPPGQNPLPPRYYRNEADALAEENEILDISNYRNIGYPGTQQIFVRVDSAILNDCLGLGAHITLNVETVPIAHPVTIDRQCDDDYDGLFPFDTSQIETTILNGQSLADVTVAYFDENNSPLPSPLPNPFLTGDQIITVRVTNNVTGDPNGPCFDETTLEFIVDDVPIAYNVTIPAACDDDEDETDGLYRFDTSTIQADILQGQTGFEVRYFTSLGTALSSPLPNPFITPTQTITAMVVNPENEDCFDITEIDFVVHRMPDFSIKTPQIVCSSDPTFTVTLDPLELDQNQYTYEWIYEDGAFLSSDPTLTVSTPGTYTITLTKTDGSNCSRSRDVFVNASELATITQEDVIIQDISNNNTITINVDNNNLGLGDYEFALNDEFGIYQDEPYFENVPAGIHTLYVRDKKGCGTSSIIISVIGHPKFFTPNGDGYNDTWQIKGINDQFQPNSIIYVFDRYGKLLKQLPATSIGWDGTFNGYLMPSDDYWFSVRLEDGRIFKGHFALKR